MSPTEQQLGAQLYVKGYTPFEIAKALMIPSAGIVRHHLRMWGFVV